MKKLLNLQELNLKDSLALFLDSSIDHEADAHRELEPFFQALEEQAGEWMPNIVDGKRRRNYSRGALWRSLEEGNTGLSCGTGLFHTTSPFVSLALSFGLKNIPRDLSVSLHIQPLTYFTEEERCRAFIDLVRAWVCRYPVSYTAAHSVADEQLAGSPYFGRDEETAFQNGYDKIYHLCWLNVFGPRLVETVGRERMLSTPAHLVEELPNGSILLVTWPTAADFASEEARKAQARALVHLRPELDFDTELRILRERSAALAPVEPRFHPDVAPLLARVVDDVAISQRQRRIAELNAYRPPEPEEWLPADAALPSDVADAKAARELYSLLAEHLVALLHTEVPSVFEGAPESLTDVDYQFWHDNFPEVFERHNIDARAVPAIGGYLGQVLVRHLGGEWIPRKKLEEAQVRVGQRVWLPFLRAHRYMRTRQALLDFSLTQLYREAERHR